MVGAAVRYRRKLVDMCADEVRRLQKVLEGGNIKLGDVATDVMGVSGRDMLRALIEREDDSARLAQFARGRLRRKQDQLQSALEGSIGRHQRFMLGHLLQHIEFVERQIAQLSAEIEARMRPFEVHMEGLQRFHLDRAWQPIASECAGRSHPCGHPGQGLVLLSPLPSGGE